MDGIRKIRSVFLISFYQLTLQMREKRTRAVFLMLFLYLGGMISPLRDFARTIGEGISPWLFPILTNDLVCSLVIFCFWCFLVCDAPFRNEGYLYYVGRVGKKIWILGQLLFLLLFSGLYILSIQLFSMILSFPCLQYTMEWGKVLGTLAYTDAIFNFPMPFSFPVTLMSAMTPVEASGCSMLLAWLAAFLLGVGIMTINYVGKTSVGAIAAVAWVLLDITVNNVMDYIWLRYSPISLTRLSILRGAYTYLTPAWAIQFLMGSVLGMIAVLMICAKVRKGLE